MHWDGVWELLHLCIAMSGIYGRIIIMSNTLEKFIHFCEFAPFLSLSRTCENLNEIISPRFYLPLNF
jgi:hypothetical protein